MSKGRITLSSLKTEAAEHRRFAMLTAYDSTFASTAEQAGVDVLLVGDSLGMVLQGRESTLAVTIDEIAYHTSCVARGSSRALIMADMPFMSFQDSATACIEAAKLMRAGAHVVKLEGNGWLCETVVELGRQGVPVCVHMGLAPQSVHKLGGYKVQGKTVEAAEKMLTEAVELSKAGADMLLLECVPPDLAGRITGAVDIPVIGIGAGPQTDAQVLVLHDMLGLGNRKPAKFVRDFMKGNGSISEAIAAYVHAVKDGTYPGPEHCFANTAAAGR